MKTNKSKTMPSLIEDLISEHLEIEDYIVNNVINDSSLFYKENGRETAYILYFDKRNFNIEDENTAYLIFIQKYNDFFFWNIVKKFSVGINDLIDLHNEFRDDKE